jgi:hypothetical protein
MATRSFTYSFPGNTGETTFPLPFDAQGAITTTVNGGAVTASVVAGNLVLAVALVAPSTIKVTGTTSDAAAAATAPGTPITALTVATTGTSSNSLGAITAVSTLVNSSGGTVNAGTIAAVTDIATAANAIASLTSKLNTIISINAELRNSITSLGNKVNESVAVLKASKLAT